MVKKAETKQKMSWVVYNSPLWKKDKVPTSIKPSPRTPECQELEKNFVNDGIKTNVYNKPRKRPIIPPYDAVKDEYAQAYFKSPVVQGIIDRHESLKEMKEEKTRLNLNKLSARRRIPLSPGEEELEERTKKFVNDGIFTERRRTKYKDVIPEYDATNDHHTNHYTKRPDVQRLLAVTCTPRGGYK